MCGTGKSVTQTKGKSGREGCRKKGLCAPEKKKGRRAKGKDIITKRTQDKIEGRLNEEKGEGHCSPIIESLLLNFATKGETTYIRTGKTRGRTSRASRSESSGAKDTTMFPPKRQKRYLLGRDKKRGRFG